ncbi:hypothetical protein HDU82_003325, partial [Entophlyctis luteolus]
MTIWNIKAMKRYICLGTWGYRQSSLAAGIQGRVLVYSLKYDSGKSATNGGYKMKQLGEFNLPEMVFSVQTFMNSDSLSRSPADTIALSETEVLVADRSGELFCLAANDGSNSINNGTASGSNNVGGGGAMCFKTVFSINLGEMVTRLQAGQLDGGLDPEAVGLASMFADNDDDDGDNDDYGDDDGDGTGSSSDDDEVGSGSAKWHGQDKAVETTQQQRRRRRLRRGRRWRAVYASTIVGGLYVVRGLTRRARHKLLVLVDVLAEHPATRPLLGNDHARFRASGYFPRGSRNIVDGDMVKRARILSCAERADVVARWNAELRRRDEDAVDLAHWLEVFLT